MATAKMRMRVKGFICFTSSSFPYHVWMFLGFRDTLNSVLLLFQDLLIEEVEGGAQGRVYPEGLTGAYQLAASALRICLNAWMELSHVCLKGSARRSRAGWMFWTVKATVRKTEP